MIKFKNAGGLGPEFSSMTVAGFKGTTDIEFVIHRSTSVCRGITQKEILLNRTQAVALWTAIGEHYGLPGVSPKMIEGDSLLPASPTL